MVVISSTLSVGQIGHALSDVGEPVGDGGKILDGAFPRFADDFTWWIDAAKAQRARQAPPY